MYSEVDGWRSLKNDICLKSAKKQGIFIDTQVKTPKVEKANIKIKSKMHQKSTPKHILIVDQIVDRLFVKF